jgi:hypothetical protein
MKELQSISVVAPGFAGINTQESSVTLPNIFALSAVNCVIDKYGRLGARKGWTQLTTSGSTALAGDTVSFLLEHVNANNTSTFISAGNNKVFTGGVGAALTNRTPSGYTITQDDWSGATLNDLSLLVQAGHEPLVYDATATPVLQAMTDYTAIAPSYGSSFPRQALAAYGRFWVHDGKNIYWSTDIADSNFPAFSGGSSGFLNIASSLPNNVDTITAIGAHNGFLIIFCEKNIVIYRGAENVISDQFGLEDVIEGVGCVARDSVQNTGGDIIFLSANGLRSLGRIIQEKSLPMRDLSANVRDDLIGYIDSEPNKNKIKAVYSETEAFYLLSFPATQTVYCFDMRKALDDGSARVTLWQQFPITASISTRDFKVYLGKVNGIGQYTGYLDDGTSYRMRYESNHMDFQDSTITKVVKKINCTVIGGNGQPFFILSGNDYRGFEHSYELSIKVNPLEGEWGTAEWNIFEWTEGVTSDRIETPANGSGKTLQVAFETIIDGEEFSVQRIDVFVKLGRKS